MAGENNTEDETNANQLKVLVHKRGQCKAKLTRFRSFLESSTLNYTEVKLRLAKVGNIFNEFEDVQTQLEILDSNDESQLEERETFESLFFSLSAQAEDYIQSNAPQSQSATSNSSTHNNNNSGPSTSSQVQVRLPSIELPTFSGNYEDWLSFSETFNALIHDNESLNDVQRFHYLRSALKGEAAQVVQSLELISSNYLVAFSLLENRYKNKRLIVQKHVKALFDLPSVERDAGPSLRTLLDGALRHIRALKALEEPTDSWDTLLLHLITSKLNQGLQRDWELSTQPDTLPKFNELTDFLQRRCQILETTHNKVTIQKPTFVNTRGKPVQKTCLLAQNNSCRLCNGNHPVYQCQDLLKRSQAERYQKLRQAGVCFNCLKPGHRVSECTSRGCRHCLQKHNTVLHPPDSKSSQRVLSRDPMPEEPSKKQEVTLVSAHTAATNKTSSQVLLSTAVVNVISHTGKQVRCRALLDNGSQSCFMTENMCQQLGLPRANSTCQVLGVNNIPIRVKGTTTATIKSCVTSYNVNLTFVVVPKITGEVPRDNVDVDHFKIPKHITLADPNFGNPSKIDLLLGQEIFFEILCIRQQKTRGFPTLQKTRLGWIVGGKIECSMQNPLSSQSACILTTNEQISSQLQKFWTLEEPTTKVRFTSEEMSCEEHFKENTTRGKDGRYTVLMPFRADPQELGGSREVAIARFTQLERKLARDSNVHKQYCEFMNEYQKLNHMEKVEEGLPQLEPDYYLPHHAVIKSSSTTTKLRVVFDASACTSSGLSLNDIQMVGPTVQSDIVSIFLRFRTHNVVLTADIEKMYRQVSMNPSQRNLLKIVWRETPSQPLQTYRLNTVTYGTASAPYLATRTLMQLAEDEKLHFPNSAEIVKRDFYVDDLLTGANNDEEALLLKAELITLLSKGKFNLRKWSSNSPQIRENLRSENCEQINQEMSSSTDPSIKTLGLWWDSERDQFHFKHSHRIELKNNRQVTKRIVMSEIARLFDPLGLVAPVIIRAKMQLQELWRLNLNWDESLPMHLHTEWIKLLGCLNDLNHVAIDRQATLPQSKIPYELHGFSDASEKAYGGVVYLRHEDDSGNVRVNLMCAKSRVAPLKTTSLPRLELCAALLLSELMQHVASALEVPSERITYWSDSTVVLAWLQSEPARWTTFVANRVSKVQDITRHGDWRHVKSEDNPADVVSRGTQAQTLVKLKLWWNGPKWLASDRSQWSPEGINEDSFDVPEQRQRITSLITTRNEGQTAVSNLVERCSSFSKVTRVVAYCLRFTKNLRKISEGRRTGPLDVEELQEAKLTVVRYVQQEAFPHEVKQLKSKEMILSKELQRLAPFMDKSGVIRVGGRLAESGLPYDTKHPMLLPKNHKITEMIVQEEHIRNLHCGAQALLYAVRQQYWPISGRRLARKVTLHCIRCFKAKPKETDQLMGNLPSSRVAPAKCFKHTGVDYCGPFYTKQTRRRGAKTAKSYVCVFVCLATKAVHLELVSDLSTDTFLGALRRFVARRGMCAEIRSDNGKNFVGANRELKELRQFFEAEASTIVDTASREGIRWMFNPPYSPHMGGLWEAAVKSLKHHLKRIVGNASLTFEEFNTVLTQVEAVLNSRPLTPMSSDPSDLSVLTPAHFLTFGSLTAIPEPSLMPLQERRLSRWQRVQQLLQHFWTRWSREYLNNLQQRDKWKSPRSTVQVGTLVLLKDDKHPPLSWPMGRVIQLHTGKDNLVRVVTVKTSTGVVSRAINKLCPLPV